MRVAGLHCQWSHRPAKRSHLRVRHPTEKHGVGTLISSVPMTSWRSQPPLPIRRMEGHSPRLGAGCLPLPGPPLEGVCLRASHALEIASCRGPQQQQQQQHHSTTKYSPEVKALDLENLRKLWNHDKKFRDRDSMEEFVNVFFYIFSYILFIALRSLIQIFCILREMYF